MKAGIASIVLSVALTGAATVWADDAHHPEPAGPQAATPAAGAGKTKPALPNAKKPPPASAAADKQFEQARQQMKTMLAQMDKIHQTKDPKERQRLMDEHKQSMRDTMQAMHAMGGPMMMDMMGGAGTSGSSGKPMEGGMNPGQRMDRMEQRIDMMQMMMEQMVTRQSQQMPAP